MTGKLTAATTTGATRTHPYVRPAGNYDKNVLFWATALTPLCTEKKLKSKSNYHLYKYSFRILENKVYSSWTFEKKKTW